MYSAGGIVTEPFQLDEDVNEKMYNTLEQKDIQIREAKDEQERLKHALHEFKKTYNTARTANEIPDYQKDQKSFVS